MSLAVELWLELICDTAHTYSSSYMCCIICRFSKRKGYYCAIGNMNRDICLGRGKGCKYPPTSGEDNYYLTQYYSAHNKRSFNILNVLGFKAPTWILNRTYIISLLPLIILSLGNHHKLHYQNRIMIEACSSPTASNSWVPMNELFILLNKPDSWNIYHDCNPGL